MYTAKLKFCGKFALKDLISVNRTEICEFIAGNQHFCELISIANDVINIYMMSKPTD